MTSENSPSIKSSFMGYIAIIFLIGSLTACDQAGFGGNKEDDEEKEEIAIPVESGVVERGSITAFYPSTTTLESEREASVVAKVGGIVEKYFVEEGDQVKAGQPLVQLETDRLKLELTRSEANLNKLKNDLQRNKTIYKKNLVSSEAFDKLKFEYASQTAAYELAKLELTFATVEAPIDGVISKRYVKVGNMIDINEPVYHITDFDPLHAVVYIPEKELYKIALEQRVMIQVDARKDHIFNGFVKRISPIVDANSGTFKVTVEVIDPQHYLKPGMFGRLQIIHDTHTSALLIEKKALLTEDTVTSVFVIRDGRAFKQTVKVGFVDNKHIEILSGLNENNVIVTTGQNSLKNDSLIEILGQEPEPEPESESESESEPAIGESE
ncbi:MAG: efflux transporter periplasmic adaptor subunit [Gammaproteobacteria bacterium]|nr:MAG: efflux transporter periplasmic adaptor subunit [Gammaproteobacteria bacterium]